MSHLLKALQDLETRGTSFATSPVGPAFQNEGGEGALLTLEKSIEQADDAPASNTVAELPTRIKPRPALRVKPRRAAGQPAVEAFAPRPLMETLGQNARLPGEHTPPVTASAAAHGLQYTLAPAVVVNQTALNAGAALARELGVPQVVPANEPSSTENPVRTATLFENRIRETILHPARSRPFAELVQRLRQDFRGTNERSLLFTGIGLASRGDEMLAHVAALFAEQGEDVLLVDADFERAGLSAGIGAGTLGGLQNALVAPRTWRDHVISTSFKNLAFLPTGRGNLNIATAADTLNSFIPKLEAEFPLVLIDGGQSNGSLLTPLARSCDATYFVIRLGATDAKEAQGALKTFRAAGARVMGCVAVMANGE